MTGVGRFMLKHGDFSGRDFGRREGAFLLSELYPFNPELSAKNSAG